VCSWNWSLAEELALLRELGVAHMGLSLRKLAPDDEAAIASVEGSGIGVANLINVGGFRPEDPDGWPAARDHLKRVVDLSVRLGGPPLVMTTGRAGSMTWEEAADRFEEAGAPVFAHARAAGVDFAIEHTNSLRVDVGFVHTLRDAIDLARRLDTGVCMEMNACWAERDLVSTIRRGIDRIRLVQVSDFKVGTIASSQRLVPGDGDIPIARIIDDLLTAGYEGAFELELIGDAIVEEGYDTAIPRAVTALDALLTSG
jgi:sugar phosphate isomerase/epimerase